MRLLSPPSPSLHTLPPPSPSIELAQKEDLPWNQSGPYHNSTGGDLKGAGEESHSGTSMSFCSWWRVEALANAPVFGGEQRNEDQKAFVFDLALSPSSAGGTPLLAAATSDGSVRVTTIPHGRCDLTDGASAAGSHSRRGQSAQQLVAVLETEHVGHLTSVCWRPDGRTLASTCGDGTTLLWDARTWRCCAVLRGVHQRTAFGATFCGGFRGSRTGGTLGYERIGEPELLMTYSSDGSIAFWDTATGNLWSSHSGINATGERIACVLESGGGDALRSNDGQHINETEATTVHLSPLAACTTPEGSTGSFPLLRCAISDDARAVAVAGGMGGASSFLGTPVWFHDL